MSNKGVNNDSKKFKIALGVIVVQLIIIIILLILLLSIKIRYIVNFDSNGGSPVHYIAVERNDLAIKPEDPTREGYTFAGWYYNDELFDFSTPIKGDIELEARWVESGKVAGVKFNYSELTLDVGDSMKLKAIITPEDAKDKTLIWESSNPKVVSVDSKGNIKALKEGTATIKVTTKDGGFTAEIKITVNKVKEKETSTVPTKKPSTTKPSKPVEKPTTPTEKPSTPVEKPSAPTEQIVSVTGVSLNKTNLNLYVKDTAKLTATIKPSNASNKKLIWSSSNPSVATVDQNGNIKAVAKGTTTITVKTEDGGYTAICIVTVSDKYVVTFKAEPLYGDVTAQYSVVVTKNGSTCSYKHIIYNGKKLGTYADAEKLSTKLSTATVRLTDGTDVTATVVFR